ncbi:hypothetical protein H0H87_011154 [Tephrocybe sp. NHM501043]|nr:hypothetical protein H0H87_011154 [Tephrocybe sp. NHM501043]
MSKRPKSDSSSLSRRKRQKITEDQPLIHQFFSSSSKKTGISPTQNASSRPSLSPSGSLSKSISAKVPTAFVIDVDAFDDDGAPPPSGTAEPGSSVLASSPPAKELLVAKLSDTSQSLVFSDLTYDPAEKTIIEKPWPSASVPYSFIAHTLSTLSQTRSRIKILNVLTNCLYLIISHDSQSLLSALYLLSNTLAPPYSSLELGLGPSIISRSIQNVSGLTSSALKRLYNSTGDAGDVAFAAKTNLRTLLPHPPLLVKFVYTSLLKIAHSKGQGAAKEKEKIVEKLLLAATGEEVRFLTRTLSQNLRVGAVRTTILTALARAMVLIPVSHLTFTPTQPSLHVITMVNRHSNDAEYSDGDIHDDHHKEQLAAQFERAESLIKRVYVQHPNYEDITSALLQGGLNGLQERVYLTIGGNSFGQHYLHIYLFSLGSGIPLHPTLGSPTRSIDEIYEISRNRPFIAEFKYDGQRAQIHGSIDRDKVLVRIFSRHLEDMTSKYPDVVHLVKAYFHDHPETTSFILDTEVVAIDSTGGLQSFQELSNRARKDVQLHDIRVFVSVFAFDLMYLDGEVSAADAEGLTPEVYFKPSEVWEIRGADITLSPVSDAAKGLVSASRGLSLRFPRFLRVREDKSVEHASTPEFLVKMWKDQEKRGLVRDDNDEGDLVDVELDASASSSEAESSED